MIEDCPSATALRIALQRAAHQVVDDPRIFDDPLALRILNLEAGAASGPDPGWPERTSASPRLRAFLAVRSRYAEDELHAAVKRGVRQYVVLGAGLDTFACRNPYPEGVLRVFEVDHPATQAWKRAQLEQAAIPIPPTLTFSPVNFETQTLEQGLLEAGFDMAANAYFSWLGVTQYLSVETVMAALGFVSSMPAGSSIVFDYTISPFLLGPGPRRAFDALVQRVARAGEPFRAFFDPSALKNDLAALGFTRIEDLSPEALNARYFRERTDDLHVSGFTHVMNAGV